MVWRKIGAVTRRVWLAERPAPRPTRSAVTSTATIKGEEKDPSAWYSGLAAFLMAKLSAPRSLTIRRAIDTARLSPSTANGTSSIRGVAPGTKVIMGCREAVLAPLRFSGDRTLLVSAPLE